MILAAHAKRLRGDHVQVKATEWDDDSVKSRRTLDQVEVASVAASEDRNSGNDPSLAEVRE
jgi:hypothetical protein